MGVASLVLGIISALIGFIPFIGIVMLIPAIVGLILGIIDIMKKKQENKPKGMPITGTILSGVSLLVIIYWIFLLVTTILIGIGMMSGSELTDILSNSSYSI